MKFPHWPGGSLMFVGSPSGNYPLGLRHNTGSSGLAVFHFGTFPVSGAVFTCH